MTTIRHVWTDMNKLSPQALKCKEKYNLSNNINNKGKGFWTKWVHVNCKGFSSDKKKTQELVEGENMCRGMEASRLVCLPLDQVVQGSRPGQWHCSVFLGKTLYSHSASLSARVYKKGPAN